MKMPIEPWRAKAYEYLPSFRELIERAEDASMLWIELSDLKIEAMSERLSDDEISGLFRYASWCLLSGDEKCQNAALIEFYERLPVNQLRPKLHDHLSVEEFLGLKDIFEYNLSEEEHKKLIEEFMASAGRKKIPIDGGEA
jgi:hypothetical protein